MELTEEQQTAFMEMQMMEQKNKQLEAQTNAIAKQIAEMEGLIESLIAIEKNDEALLPIGKGIFFKNKITNKNLLLNIGSGIIIEKDIPVTIKLIKEQITKLNEMAMRYQEEFMKAQRRMEELISKLQ